MIHWQPYLIAIVIGLLVGIEREKAHPTSHTMGVRTFLLISLLGALAGDLQNAWLSGLVAVFALALIVLSYAKHKKLNTNQTNGGLTTPLAGGIIFCLGYAAHARPTLAAMMGPVVAVILFSKASLHRFTKAIQPAELEAALLLLLAGVVIVNLVPNTEVDRWHIFNPQKFGFIVLTLATLEFCSYLLAKMIGEKRSSLAVGFLGGIVSSTAVLLSSARKATAAPNNWRTFFCSTLASQLAALSLVLFIVGIVSPDLALQIAPVLGVGLLWGAVTLYASARNIENATPGLVMRSPLEWRGVLRLSLLLAVILAVISVAKISLGKTGIYVLSFLTGLFELHGVSLAQSTMFAQNQISLQTATQGVYLAVIASLFAKMALSWTVNRGAFSRALTAALVPMIILMGIVACLFPA